MRREAISPRFPCDVVIAVIRAVLVIGRERTEREISEEVVIMRQELVAWCEDFETTRPCIVPKDIRRKFIEIRDSWPNWSLRQKAVQIALLSAAGLWWFVRCYRRDLP